MAYIVTRIQVGDYDTWKPMFDLDGPGTRREATGHQVLRNVDDPNEVYIFIEYATRAARGVGTRTARRLGRARPLPRALRTDGGRGGRSGQRTGLTGLCRGCPR